MARHFDRYLKNGFHKSLGRLLLLTLLLAGLGISASKLKLKGDSSLPFGHPIQQSGLSCEQVIKLAHWGSQRFGGIGHKDVFNRERATKIAQVFIEKIDPSRMLFTAQEAEGLKKVALSHWSDLLENKSCESWQSWLEENYPKAQQRISHWIENYKTPQSFQLKLNKKNAPEKNEKDEAYTQFAQSGKELEKRWQKELTELLDDSSLAVFKAYQQNLRQFLWDQVEQKYFDVAPDTHGLLAKAFLGGLDKYSTYFSPLEFEDFYEDLKGTSAGLGLRLQKVPQGFMIEKVVEASSAQKSNRLHEGDIIEKVDDVNLSSLPLEEAKQLLKGPEHSKVRLGVECSHQGNEIKMSELVLERTQFELEESKISFVWKHSKNQGQESKKVAVISVPTFYGRGGLGASGEEKSVSEDVKQKIHDELLSDSSHAGLVLDLRGNPGGYLEEAVSMGSFFVGDKPIVGVLEDGATRVLKDETVSEAIYQKPLVVLVDQGSASAAEVLSGALKDYQRAVIVGSSRTYGKGTVQKLFQLEDPLLFSSISGPIGTGVLKLTTSVFYSPLGHTPANGGVIADIALNRKEPQELASLAGEIHPLVDSELQNEIERGRLRHQEEIRTLEEKSQERLAQDKNIHSQKELDEAIAIVSDLNDLQIF